MTKYIAYVTALTLPLMLTTITASAAQQDTNAVSATGKATPHFKGDNLSKDAKISLKEARTIALKTSPGKIVDEELEVEDGGSGLRYSFVIQHGSANREVGVVDAAHDVGARGVEDLVAALQSLEVLQGQVRCLKHRAHRTIGDHDPLSERVEQVGAASVQVV